MAPKKKDKTKQSDWLQCSLCGKVFVPNDAELHASSCDTDHGYIDRKILYGKVINVEGIQLKDGSPLLKTVREYNSVVWLSIPAMQLCGLSIGQPCVINKTVIKRAWPNQTPNLASVAMTTECMNEMTIQKGDTVTVEKLVAKGETASMLELILQEQNPLFETSEFCAFVSSYLDGKYVTQGTPLTIHYFGLMCHCLVSGVHARAENVQQVPALDVFNSCTPSKEKHQSSLNKSTHDESSSGEDFLIKEADTSCLSSTDINLSMASLNISNTSLEESFLSQKSPSTPRFPNITSLGQVFLDDDQDKVSSGLSFFLVSSKFTKCSVKPKNGMEATKSDFKFTLSDVGGLAQQISELKTRIARAQGADSGSCCILVHGPPGTGKSLLVKAMTTDLGLPTYYLAGADIWSKLFGEAESNLRKTFLMAQERAPSIIVIDNFDVVCPKRSLNTAGQQEHRIVGTLLSLIDNLVAMKNSAPVVVIGITNKKDDLDPALRRAGRFGCEIEVGVPTADQRLEILQVMLTNISTNLTNEQLETVARNSHGYVGADLAALVNEAILLTTHKHDPDSPLFEVTFNDLVQAGSHIKPSALREIQLEVSQVRWSDIGGMSEVKMRLQEAVVLPLTNPEVFRRLGIAPPKGLLMYGPPGCSKTMVAKALATECKFNFLAVKGPELFNQYVGESEKAVREIFRKARSASPAIIFFDEIDAIASKRGSSSGSGVDDRVLTQLLTEMDGLEFLKDVFIMAATNRPDKIDHALLRPGRFDSLVYVPLPDNATRKEILEKKLSRMCISEDVQKDLLVELTIDYSGAEIIQVCQEAALCALREDLQTKCVQQKHFDQALKKVQPQIDPELLQIYQKFSNSRLK
ncbi:spermatogenesis-associated protein 5 [Biomphalaria glabrata]|nr:spermatogenesis-associated protein 5 [Biomphalaria glabrata]